MRKELFSCLSSKRQFTPAPKLPKLLFKKKKDVEEFERRVAENKITQEDIENFVEALWWLGEALASKEPHDPKEKNNKKDI